MTRDTVRSSFHLHRRTDSNIFEERDDSSVPKEGMIFFFFFGQKPRRSSLLGEIKFKRRRKDGVSHF